MTPDALSEAGQRLYGYGWQTQIARHFEVSPRSVRRWVSGDNAVPDRIAADIEAMLSIRPPDGPPDGPALRVEACADALRPDLSRLMGLARRAGWTEPEVRAAMAAVAKAAAAED